MRLHERMRSISVRGWRSAAVYRRLRYAPCLTLQTLCVALLFILDLHYAEQPYSIPPQKTHTEYGVCFFVPRLSQWQKKDTANTFFNLKTFCNMKTCRFQQALCFFGFCHKTIFYSFASVSHIRQLIQMFQR